MLLEYNNTFLRPHYEAHSNFLTGRTRSCRFVLSIEEKCEFVMNTKSCHEFEGWIDYSNFIFCILLKSQGSQHILFTHIALTFMIVGYAGLVFNIAYTKSAPNFIAVTKYIKLPEHTIGIIIAIATGMPELIRDNYYRLREDDTEAVVSLMLGKNVYTKTLALGILLIYFPIRVYPRHKFRDLIFYVASFCAFLHILSGDYYNKPVFNGLLIVVVFLTFLIVVFSEEIYNAYIYKGVLDPLQQPINSQLTTRNREVMPYKTANHRLFAQFIIQLNPLKIEKFYTTNIWLKKVYFMLFPFRILIDLVIPAVDFRREREGWTKLFNCINVVTLPMVVFFLYKFSMLSILKVTLVTFILSVIVFFTSRTDQPPKYHIIFAICGGFGSIVICYYTIAELLAVLNLVGIMFSLQQGTIGLLLLIPFDVAETLVIGLTIANYGYPNIAYASFNSVGLIEITAFGTTLLTSKLMYNKHQIPLRLGVFGQTIIVFIFLELVVSIIIGLATNLNLRKSIGWFYVFFAIVFALFILAVEAEFIHALGTDHNPEKLEQITSVDWA